jgi:ankyrin repeat protein
MFASFYANIDAVEFLAASDAVAQVVDKKGRSYLHYAAINDSAQLIETIFLHAKANPNPVKPATDLIDITTLILDKSNLGNLDERYHGMENQMNLIDTIFTEITNEATHFYKAQILN